MQVNDVSGSTRATLGQLGSSLVRNWAYLLLALLLGAVVGLGYSLAKTPVYSSTATMYVTSANSDSSNSAYQGSLASQQRVDSYTWLARSGSVLESAIDRAGIDSTPEQARSRVVATTRPDTVLLFISATGDTPEDAALLSNSVAEATAEATVSLETPASGGAPLAKLTVITPASAEPDAISPRPVTDMLIGALLALAIGAAGIIVYSRFSRRISSETDLSESVEKPVLAMIPSLDTAVGPVQSGAATRRESFSILESYNRLRANLAFCDVDRPSRTILVTSAVAGDGKTTTSIGLAAAFANAGKRVVLIDADLRRPTAHKQLGILGSIGLTDVLRREAAVSDVIQSPRDSGFDVIASGPVPPNPATLIESRSMANLVDTISDTYDIAIIDSPPVTAVVDSVVLAVLTDCALLVSRCGHTRTDQLRAAYSELQHAGANVAGTVLVDVPRSRKGTYESYYAQDGEIVTASDERDPEAHNAVGKQ